MLCLKLTLPSLGAQHSEISYYQSDHCKGFFCSSITLSLHHFPFCHSFLLLYSFFFFSPTWDFFCHVHFSVVIWTSLQVLWIYWDPQLQIKFSFCKLWENRFSSWVKVCLVFLEYILIFKSNFVSVKHQPILLQLWNLLISYKTSTWR